MAPLAGVIVLVAGRDTASTVLVTQPDIVQIAVAVSEHEDYCLPPLVGVEKAIGLLKGVP